MNAATHPGFARKLVSIVAALCIAMPFLPAPAFADNSPAPTVEEAKAALDAAKAAADEAQASVDAARKNAEDALAQAIETARSEQEAEQQKLSALTEEANQADADASAAKTLAEQKRAELQTASDEQQAAEAEHNRWIEVFNTNADLYWRGIIDEALYNKTSEELGKAADNLYTKQSAYENAKTASDQADADYQAKLSAQTAAQAAVGDQEAKTQAASKKYQDMSSIDVDAIISGSAAAPDGATENAVSALKSAQQDLDDANAALARAQDEYDAALRAARAQTVAADDVTATYGDTGKFITATGIGALSYEVAEGADVVSVDAGTGALTILKAGTAKVKVTASGNDDYDPAETTVTVTVNKAVPEYPLPPSTVTLQCGQIIAEADPALPEGFQWEKVYSSEAFFPKADTHRMTVSFTPSDTENYQIVRGIPVDLVIWYSVTWDGNGGTVDATGATLKGKKGTVIVPPTNDPSKDPDHRYHYAFAGWYTEAEGGEPLEAGATPDTNVTYYAHWTEEEHTWGDASYRWSDDYTARTKTQACTSCSYGQTEPADASCTVAYRWTGDDALSVTLPPDDNVYDNAALAKEAKDATFADATIASGSDGYLYSFSGWDEGTVDGQTVTFSGTWANTGRKDASKWATVTYADGTPAEGAFRTQSTEVLIGSATPAFDGTPERDGYSFAGWSPEVAETVTADAAYTAQWTKNEEAAPAEDATPAAPGKTAPSSKSGKGREAIASSPKTADPVIPVSPISLAVLAACSALGCIFSAKAKRR